MPKRLLDPEYERWTREYPQFPGVRRCVELLDSPNVRGSRIDIICSELQQHSADDPSELIDAIDGAPNQRLRFILIDVLEVSAPDEAVSILSRMLTSQCEEDRTHAIDALKRIGSKEARTALFRAGAA